MTDDDQLLSRPIVVIGAPRSGTSMLSQLLKAHPALYLANEPRILWKYGNDAKSDLLQPADARPEVVRHIRREFARQVREAGRLRLAEKTPSNSLRLGFVERVLPDAIYLHILREGVESTLSIRKFWEQHGTGISGNARAVLWRRLKEVKLRQLPHYAAEFARRVAGQLTPTTKTLAIWGPRLPGIREMARDLDLLEVAALQWRMCVERACLVGRELPAERYTECRLEDFDEEEFRRLLAFCSLEAGEEVMQAFHKKFDARPPGARSEAAADEEVQHVRKLLEPTTQWLASRELLRRH